MDDRRWTIFYLTSFFIDGASVHIFGAVNKRAAFIANKGLVQGCVGYTIQARPAARRTQLMRQLRASLLRIRDRARGHTYMSQIIHDHATLLLHAVCGTPFVLASLDSDAERARLLTLTGEFLEFICKIRPL